MAPAAGEASEAEAPQQEAEQLVETRMAPLLDDLGIAVWSTRFAEGRGISANTAAERLFGRTREELLGLKSLAELMDPTTPIDCRPQVAACDATGQAEFDVRVLLPSAPPRWVHMILRQTRDAGGKVLGRDGVAFDITARREAEDTQRTLAAELEQRVAARTADLADLYDNAPCGYHTFTADGTIVQVNATELAWLGRTREEVVGCNVEEFLTPESRAVSRATRARLAADPSLRQWNGAEREFVRRDGSTFWAVTSGTCLRDGEGRLLSFRSTLIDITEHKRAEARAHEQDARLAEALAEAQEAGRAKDDFLAGMSHELRTPLNGVLGLGEALLEGVYGKLTEAQARAVSRSRASGEHLLSLINDILDVAKVGAGKAELEPAPVSLYELVQGSVRVVEETARRKRITVAVHAPWDEDLLLLDARRMTQVLVNLLSNAVKFTPEGGRVTVNAARDDDAETVVCSVRDDGVGIAPEDLPRLFQRFVQLDNRLDRAHAGTGLGLALVRGLARLHGGDVAVESELGKGSCFTVTVPLRPAPPAVPPVPRAASRGPAAAPPHAGRLVLIVEDDPLSAELLRDVLGIAGYEVRFVQHGGEAVELTRSLRPAVVLMDVQMPQVDGLTAIQTLRAEGDRVPIIAVTALVMPGDRERCLAAGADDYLSKPIRFKALLELIEAKLSAVVG